MGFFDLGGDKRERVANVRARQRVEQLRLNRDIKETKRRERRAELERKRLESRTATAKAEERFYETQLARKEAKRAASRWPKVSISTPRLKKKKQGKKLSRKRRITLL